MASFPPIIEQILNNIPYYDYLNDINLFGNSGIDYALVAVYFTLTFMIGYLFKFFFLGKIKNFLPQRGQEITKPVISKVSRLISFSTIVILSFYFSTLHLSIPQNLRLIINVLIFGYLVYILYRLGAGLIDIGADYRENKTEENQEHILSFIKLVGKVAIASVVLLIYLKLLRVDITGLVAGLGIAGITIAFALQNIVADLFAAIAIYLDKPFEIGDYIKVGNNVGRIEKIGIRSTHVRSIDGPLIVMANQNLTNADIINYKKMKERRIQQTVGVSAEAPIDKLRQLPQKITEIANGIDMVRVERVWLKELGNYSWNYEIIFHIEDPSIDVYRNVQEELNFRILELMDEEDIDLPYPIQELFLNGRENLTEPIASKLTTNGA